MDFAQLRNQLIALIEPAAPAQGFELVDIDVTGSQKHPVVTIYLDNGKGNQVDDLAAANTWVDELIEGAHLIEGSYILQISSPGINRPLRTLKDFETYAGQKAEVKIRAAKGERSVFKGTLRGVEDTTVLIELADQTAHVAFDDIIKAHLHVDIDFKSLKGTTQNG